MRRHDAKRQTELPLGRSDRLDAVLDAIDKLKLSVLTLVEPEGLPPAPPPPAVRLATPAPAIQNAGKRGIVEFPGRLLSDGSRRGATQKRRTTVYLTPDLATALAKDAVEQNVSMSDLVCALLAERYR